MRGVLFFLWLGLATAEGQLQPVPLGQLSGPAILKLNVVFLGDGFTHGEEMDTYRKTVDQYKDALLEIAPFKDYQKAFNFWRVDVESSTNAIPHTPCPDPGEVRPETPATALGVRYFGTRLVHACPADEARISQLARRPEWNGLTVKVVPVVIANDKTYGGGELTGQGIVYVSMNSKGPMILQHELGHSFCADPDGQLDCLHDEYTEKGSNAKFPETWRWRLPPNLVPPLCDAMKSWCNDEALNCDAPLPRDLSCEQGGLRDYNQDLFHSYVKCKMIDVDEDFCPVCSAVIRRMLWSYKKNGEAPPRLVTSRRAPARTRR
jgi:hypothetical protein